MAIDTEHLRSGYAELTAEFGEKGAAIVAGIPPKFLEGALNGENKYTENLDKFLRSRKSAYDLYTEEQCGSLLKLEHFIVESGSAENAAKALGVSKGTVSYIRSCKYKGDVGGFFADFTSYLKIKQENSKVFKSVDYAPTGISRNIYEAIRLVQIKGECGIITGDPGVGKTKTIEKYEADNPRNTVVITGEYFRTGVNSVLEMLAEALGVNDDKPSRLRKAVLSKLSDGMLIIVDEAQCFSFRALDSLRSISDMYQRRGATLGVAYIGNHCLRDMFRGKYSESHSQLWSRFCAKPMYYSKQITIDDIKMLFPGLVNQNMTKELYFLHSIATTTREGLRTAVRLFSAAYDSGDYSLDSLVKWAHSFDVEFQNLQQLIKRIKEVSA